MKRFFIPLLSMIVLSFSGCSDVENLDKTSTISNLEINSRHDAAVGYIYTTTNSQSTNQVVSFARLEDGSLVNEIAYSTNSEGGADITAGGDARGDFDTQDAIQIIDDFLLTVNAGGNEISVFDLDRSNGQLKFKSNTNSGGTRPVSIAYYPVGGSPNNYWVVVGNQWNNPNVQKGGPGEGEIERYPNDAFHMMDLTQPDATDKERNITLFRFNSKNGKLNRSGVLDTFVRENGGPVNVTFSPDGSKIAVSLWGIAHFSTQEPLLTEQHASRVYVYDFKNGKVSNKRFFEEEGVSGTIGIDWAPGNNNIIYSANFNVLNTKQDRSLLVLSDNGNSVSKIQMFPAGPGAFPDEACWTQLSPNGDRLYLSSFATNAISPFTIGGGGMVSSPLPVTLRGDIAPPADSKDIWISSDNKYLYHNGAFQSFSLNIFDITATGVTYREQICLETTIDSKLNAGVYNFMGLTGFDRE
ncbi:MAG: hypothetical protein ABIO60_01765 [Aquaticitalea sp.]